MRRQIAAALVALLTFGGVALALAAPAFASYSYTCPYSGSTGVFADSYPGYPSVYLADFSEYGHENDCYGISPGRRIWDTSAGHPWYQVPGAGRADGIVYAYWAGLGNAKVLVVWVASSGNWFCQAYQFPGGWEGSWSLCYVPAGVNGRPFAPPPSGATVAAEYLAGLPTRPEPAAAVPGTSP